ncbi:MAG: lipopolysaccharide biosynthesis protein [Deltaproteobacteria bacterium]|nr:lipopolysaccharide biosynthesis protein [Deltaproteobacteria bacterium]
MIDIKTPNISDYISLVRRRKHYIIIPFLAVVIGAAIVAYILPPIYKSSCTILVEGQQIPSEFVRSTVTTIVEEAIQTITQQVMSRTKLLEIIDRFDLYADKRDKKTTEEIIEIMRGDINLKTISANVRSRSSRGTVAFSLSYEGKNPGKVQKVTNELASLYLEQNLKSREEKAKTTSAFIESELKDLGEHINQLEDKIADFKSRHMQALPEMAQVNFQMVQRLEQNLSNIDQQIQGIKERKVYLKTQLASIDPGLPGVKTSEGSYSDAEQRLEYLNTEYTSLKASLSEKHPDVIKIKKEIEALGKEVSLKKKVEIKQDQLEKMKADLASKEVTLSPKHPDIVKLKRSIEILEKEIGSMSKKGPGSEETAEKPTNPTYISLQTQITTAEMDLENLIKARAKAKASLNNYLKRLELAPQIEKEYRLLTRDYENARDRYQKTLNKLMEAKTAEAMEKSQKGQKFTIIDPAIYPEKPYKPNRMAIALIGLILGLGAGVGSASLREFFDDSIRSERELIELANKPVLAVIPYIETDLDVTKKRHIIIIALTALAVCLGLSILAIHLFYTPLDILWFKVLRKVG